MNKFLLGFVLIIISAPLAAMAQQRQQQPQQGHAPTQKTKTVPAKQQKLSVQQKFVLDVVQSAVALPQSDPQDRLRVLTSAASVVSPIRPGLSRQFAREGMRIEQELINSGQAPAVSVLNEGMADCASVQGFVENIPDAKVSAAEQSLISAASMCPKEALQPVQRKVEAALDQGVVAPRALLAVIEQVGAKTPWAEQQFVKLFGSLPGRVEEYGKEAPNFAAMYARMAPEVSKESATKSGIRLLDWVAKLEDGGSKNLALNITTDAMKGVLGEQAYQDALATDVMAQQVARSAGQQGEVEHEEEESVSVLEAMGNTSVDRTAELAKMAPSLRAREAAASGFATGTEGNLKIATRYFDMAFSALNDVWDGRSDKVDAPAVIEEVSEAAAQVDAIDALKRTQRLQDPSAQAIGMLAVARVVAGQQTDASRADRSK